MTDQTQEDIPAGWTPFEVKSHYSQSIAPMFVRRDPPGLGFLANPSHSNLNGVVHGGALATLADISMFVLATGGNTAMNGATLSLNMNYLRPGRLGQFIHAEGRIVREGSSIIFVEGSLLGGGEELIRFNGVIKRFRARDA